MSRRIEVEIVGDSRSLQRAFAQSERSAQKFHGEMERAGRGAVSAAIGFHGLGRAAAYASAQFLGGAGVVYAIKSTVQAAEESQRVTAQTRNALERTGLSWARYGKQIEETTLAQSKMTGFDDERLKGTFSLLVRRTGDVTRALQLNATAANLARGANIDLEAAAKIVQRASVGQARGLAALGISYTKTLTGAQLLAQINQKYANSAAAYANTAAGAQDRFGVAVENVQEAIGAKLLPKLTIAANKSADWLNNTKNSKPLVDDFAASVTLLGDAFIYAADAAGTFQRAQHGSESQLGKLGFLTKSLPGQLRMFGATWRRLKRDLNIGQGDGSGIGLGDLSDFPWNPEGSTGPAGTHGAGSAGRTPHQLAVEAQQAAERRNNWFDAMISRMTGRAGDPTSLQAQIARYQKIAALLTRRIAVTKDITRKLNLEDQLANVAVTVRGLGQQIASNQAAAAAAAAGRRADAQQQQMGWLDFAIERAGATKTPADDRRALRAKEAFLKTLIRHEGRTLALVSELWRTRQQIRDLNKKNADTDPLAGLMQVSTKQLTSILAAGTGLGVAGRRTLGQNIAGAELAPLHVHVNIDGREVGRVVAADQARTGRRTARQTSGFRG